MNHSIPALHQFPRPAKAPTRPKISPAIVLASLLVAAIVPAGGDAESRPLSRAACKVRASISSATVQKAAARDLSAPLTSESVEQKKQGLKAASEILVCFDGLGEDFEGPQGRATFRNPSDNSLAVGPDHIVQIVNSHMAVFTKKGARFDTTGKVLYGPVPPNNVFKDFGDAAANNNGDAVVRYDQLADRWLIVMPIFRRLAPRKRTRSIPGPVSTRPTR